MHCAFCYLLTFGHAVSNESRKTATTLATHFVSTSKSKKCERVNFASNSSQVLTKQEHPLFERINHD